MDRDFSIGGREFKLNKLDAFKQFHIVRRVGPILSEMLPSLKGVTTKSVDKMSKDAQLDFAAKFISPIMNGLSKLSDADSELVLFGLLSCVEVKQAGGNWAKISTTSMLMIQDLELPILLQVAGRSFMFNLSGFFSALPQ